MPHRVLGRNFRLDLKAGGGMRGWYPAQFPLVRVDPAAYFTWSADVSAQLFKFVRVHRGYYESTGLQGPRTSEAVVATQVGRILPKAAWLLGALGVPLSKRWETLVMYETRSFVTRARPSQPVAVATRAIDPDTDLSLLPRSAAPLRFESGFETLVLGIRHNPPNAGAGLSGEGQRLRDPPQYLGIGFTQYFKPYQVSVGQNVLRDVLFDGRFRGVGLAYGLTTPRGIARLYGDLDVQVGLGEVSLLEGLTLNALLPEDWLIGYGQGQAKLGYTQPLTRGSPTLLLTAEASLGGAGFLYVQTAAPPPGQSARAPTANWDLLGAVHAALTLPL